MGTLVKKKSTFCTRWRSCYSNGWRIPIVVDSERDGAHRESSFFTTFSICAIRAKFTAEWIKNSRGGEKVEDPFQAAERENQNLLVLAEWGGTKLCTQRVTRQWMHESGLFRSLLLEQYSTLASWLKIAPWIEAFPLTTDTRTIVALVINRQRTHRGRPAAEMSVCSWGYLEDNKPLPWCHQVAGNRRGGKTVSKCRADWKTGEECGVWQGLKGLWSC